ncbi:Subtilisin DY [Stieleria neptunia]|uniref:Subtilisin DY n=1 Tax=Stieleria neptunia TaxID=2527979 RepID=A0A518HJL5_9BACT|nr:S8 family serine peptidase [Stieleria neptunia]QDV41023.1 Subtilisin DY [Stieleria neptunia]
MSDSSKSPINGFLMRLPAAASGALAASGDALKPAGNKFEFEPLFSTPASNLGLAADGGGGKDWILARPKESLDGGNPWDLVHETREMMAGGLGLASGATPDLIEPDLWQDWLPTIPGQPEALAAAGDVCAFEDQNQELPGRRGEFAWHLDDRFSQLAGARDLVGSDAAIVRVAHLDTGYDPDHQTLPSDFIEKRLQRNFIDGDSPDDARDPGNTGPLRNPGHGTATLALLAGGRFQFNGAGYHFDGLLGGAPQVRVVPVRVGNSVVQLTTSSVARGIQYTVQLSTKKRTRVHVISMSMGGVASQAWADAVNQAYEAGIIYVAAAGNNFSAGFFGVPTHQIVYPARFRRVIAACGVMANRKPYYDLSFGTMQGNWGPRSSMATAISAYTPNVPWARIGCNELVNMDGAGTSSATPQIAAAAALYLQVHAEELFDAQRYPEPWMRVEAVRRALFLSADKTADRGRSEKLGNGLLQAMTALEIAPATPTTLRKTPADSAGFPFLNVLSRRGLADSPEDQMVQLEATQLIQHWENTQQINPLESAVEDPDRPAEDVSPNQIIDFMERVREHPKASKVLKARANEYLDATVRTPKTPKRPTETVPPDELPPGNLPPGNLPPGESLPGESLPDKASETTPSLGSFTPPPPPFRSLHAYAVDPSLATSLETAEISEVTLKLPWEPLKPGPVGEYLEVVDVDPPSGCVYEPVDLDAPALLAQDGLPPSEGSPQFHQQMVYSVCSLTINHFERALGRKALWRPGPPKPGVHPKNDAHYVGQLRVYPHALREANAFYSPSKIALLFGYFNASSDHPGAHLPGGRIFTCLSHDIIAHETTHALLDGMHRQFLLPSNRDVHAFHEGFADCVAMLQHFTFPELVTHQIANTRGSIDAQENLLVQLASQFGHATGRRMALRDAIGKVGEKGWQLREPDPQEYETTQEPHARGRILVSAVFDALLSIYKRRTADLLRLATGGTGILRPGAIHPDLVQRLTREVTRSAQHVLTMCIRALDYCPPTDITFGEYLRAIITADHDLVANDDLGYRVSFIEAFRRRGIYPPGIRTLSEGSLRWRSPESEDPMPSKMLLDYLKELRGAGSDHLYAESRKEIFDLQREMRYQLHAWLSRHFESGADAQRDARFLGLDPEKSFEVHSARIAYRISPDGGMLPQLLMGLLQTTTQPVDPNDPHGDTMSFEGGCTVVADLRANNVRYCIRKSLQSPTRLERQQAFALGEYDSLQATYLGARSLNKESPAQDDQSSAHDDQSSAHDDQASVRDDEPFALLHRGPSL